MFRTDLLSIITSLISVFKAIGICYNCYVDCLLARARWNRSILPSLADSQLTSMTNTNCCEFSIKTLDDGQ